MERGGGVASCKPSPGAATETKSAGAKRNAKLRTEITGSAQRSAQKFYFDISQTHTHIHTCTHTQTEGAYNRVYSKCETTKQSCREQKPKPKPKPQPGAFYFDRRRALEMHMKRGIPQVVPSVCVSASVCECVCVCECCYLFAF